MGTGGLAINAIMSAVAVRRAVASSSTTGGVFLHVHRFSLHLWVDSWCSYPCRVFRLVDDTDGAYPLSVDAWRPYVHASFAEGRQWGYCVDLSPSPVQGKFEEGGVGVSEGSQ